MNNVFEGIDVAFPGVAPIEVDGEEPRYHKYYQVNSVFKGCVQKSLPALLSFLSDVFSALVLCCMPNLNNIGSYIRIVRKK